MQSIYKYIYRFLLKFARTNSLDKLFTKDQSVQLRIRVGIRDAFPCLSCTFHSPYCAYNCALIFVQGLSGSDNKRFRYLAMMRVLYGSPLRVSALCLSVPFTSLTPPVGSSAIDSRFILGVPLALLASKHRKQGYRTEALTLNAPGSFSLSAGHLVFEVR